MHHLRANLEIFCSSPQRPGLPGLCFFYVLLIHPRVRAGQQEEALLARQEGHHTGTELQGVLHGHVIPPGGGIVVYPYLGIDTFEILS